ncbi:hypothetical protein [Rhizobium sp. G21]|nr:hypothetical protein [Rhizobium sp. G21]MBB1251639.1 hypothetical protein [Rhizobium sp. G21]
MDDNKIQLAISISVAAAVILFGILFTKIYRAEHVQATVDIQVDDAERSG